MGFMISRTVKDDLPEILDLQLRAFGEVARRLNAATLPPLEQTIEQLLEEEQNSVFLKYTEDGHIIGSVRGSLDASGTCHVGKLIVDPYCRNRGIGRQLMQALEEYFRGKASRYLLFTSEETPETLHLYGKLRYEKLNTRNAGSTVMAFLEKKA